MSNGDKILSENYFQHADHFARIYEQQNDNKIIDKKIDKEAKDFSQSETTSDKDLTKPV